MMGDATSPRRRFTPKRLVSSADQRLDILTDTRRGRVAAASGAVIAAALSVWMLFLAVGTGDAQRFIVWISGGAFIGSFALLVFGQVIGKATADWTTRRRAVVGVSISTAGVATTAIATWATNSWPTLGPVGAIGGLVIAIVGVLVVMQHIGETVIGSPSVWLTVGLAAMTLSLGVAVTDAPSSRRWAASIVVWVLGLTLFKLALTPWICGQTRASLASDDRDRIHRRALSVIVASVAAVLAAAILLFVTNDGRGYILAGWLLMLALSAIGLAGLLLRSMWTTAIWAIGAIVTAIGIVLIMTLVPAWTLLGIIVGGFAVTVGAFFVFRGEGVVVIVLFGALLAWVLIDRTEPPEAAAESQGTIVVFGDSFTAGQGAERFIPHTNSKADGANMCRRSPVSFATLVAAEFSRVALDYSCNGAESGEVAATTRQFEGDNDARLAPDGKTQLYDLTNLPFGTDEHGDVDLVLVTTGGNDAEFSTAVMSCFLPSDCDDESRRFLTLAEATEGDLVLTYLAIAAEFGSDVPPIVVVPYPSYVGAETCENAVDESEVAFANEYIAALNKAMRNAVNAANLALRPKAEVFDYFDEVDRAYGGRTLCDSDAGANFVNLLPPDGPLLRRLTPTSWHEGSAHPNERGHACTAAVLADWLSAQQLLPVADRSGSTPACVIDDDAVAEQAAASQRLQKEVDEAKGGDAWRTALPAEVRYERENPGDPESKMVRKVCEGDDCFIPDHWANDRVREFVSELMRVLAVLLIGGLLLALATIRTFPEKCLVELLIPAQTRLQE